jgi:hypothetical protein
MLTGSCSGVKRGEAVDVPCMERARRRAEQHAQTLWSTGCRCSVQGCAALHFICQVYIKGSAFFLLPAQQAV